jgi:hypothetical protein
MRKPCRASVIAASCADGQAAGDRGGEAVTEMAENRRNKTGASVPLLARGRAFERKLPVQRTTTQSLVVPDAKRKIEYMAESMGVGPSIAAFAKATGVKDSTLRAPATSGMLTPRLLKNIEKGIMKAGYKFSTDWPEWRDSSPTEENRADSLERFKTKFHEENWGRKGRAPVPVDARGAVRSVLPAPAVISRPVTVIQAGLHLWTPGQMSEAVFGQVCASIGPELAAGVRELSREAIHAIGCGDFVRQQAVAERAFELGRAHPETSLRGEGLYLKGEALRLQADFAVTREQQRALRKEAAENYGMAEDALRGDPRPIRGQARMIELAGDLDASCAGYERALAAVELHAARPHEGNCLSLVHERIRTLRHKIVCLADMQRGAPFSTPETQRRAHEIRMCLELSEIDHESSLRLFAGPGTGQEDWLCIEWFASSALHAKGWAEIDAAVHAAARLVTSLDARLRMLPPAGPLSAVELGNLRWWARGARDVQGSFEPVQRAPLTLLMQAVDVGAERETIHRLGKGLLMAGRPYWLPVGPGPRAA